jgi:hypothetical protein
MHDNTPLIRPDLALRSEGCQTLGRVKMDAPKVHSQSLKEVFTTIYD